MIEFKNFSFRYPNRDILSLKNINISISQGEVVSIAGKSGGGKSTLIKVINGLIPHYYGGDFQGKVQIKQKNWLDLPLFEKSKIVGSVFQEPMEQFFLSQVYEEVALMPSNFGYPLEKIRCSVEKSLEKMDIKHLTKRLLNTLSSGEAQRVAISCVLTLDPDIIVLDEPSSNLSEDALVALYNSLKELKKIGKTIIIAEHRFSYIYDLIDRLLVVENGEIYYNGLANKLKCKEFCMDLGLRYENENIDTNYQSNIKKTDMSFSLNRLGFKYKKNLQFVWEGITKDFAKGEITIIKGKNGAGKTTLLKVIMGLLKPTKGSIDFKSKDIKKYMVMQNPDFQFFFTSVWDEILYSCKDSNQADYWLDRFNLINLKNYHPLSLSGGEKQRLLLACAFSSDANILLFDEPTSGMDGLHINLFKEVLEETKLKNKSILIATHDNTLINKLSCEIMKI